MSSGFLWLEEENGWAGLRTGGDKGREQSQCLAQATFVTWAVGVAGTETNRFH